MNKTIKDDYTTPEEALEPLKEYLPAKGTTIWEPAAGNGAVVHWLKRQGYKVTATDLLTGQDFRDFRHPPKGVGAIVTNPPYSLKNEWLAKCYAFGLPFALLMPLEALGTHERGALYRNYGVSIMILADRMRFADEQAVTDATPPAASTFSSCWVCSAGFLAQPLIFGGRYWWDGQRYFSFAPKLAEQTRWRVPPCRKSKS